MPAISHQQTRHKLPPLFILIALMLAGCSTIPRQSTDSLVETAEQELDRGNLTNALVTLNEARQLEPENLELLNLLLRLYRTVGDASSQQLVATQILELDPENARALERLGFLSLEAGNLDAAREYFEEAVVSDSDRWAAWNGLGILADVEGRYSQAEGYYSRGLALVPEHPELMANLGWSKVLAGELQEAERMLSLATVKQPESVTTKSNLAFCLALQGRYEEAMTLYRTLYEESVAANNVGYAAFVRNDHEAARRYLESALHLKPSFYERAANNLQRTR